MVQKSRPPEADLPLRELSNEFSELATTPSPCHTDSNKTKPSVEAHTAASGSPPHLSHDPVTNSKRSLPFEFGQRHLSATDDVFAHNAWDHVTPDPAHQSYCQEQYSRQRLHPVSAFDQARFNSQPAKWWDLFYRQKSSTFFKDRRWLRQEFPILDSVTRRGAGTKVVLEVGAGAGNTAFPIVRANENAELTVHAVDFSAAAVETIRAAPEYDARSMRADVWDVASESANDSDNEGLPPGLTANSVDIVIITSIFSALSPTQWAQATRNIHRVLKPGGEILFRDYGRGDLAQVRFRAGRWMAENFYVRGDGTRVYFFDRDELVRIWGGGGEADGGGGGDAPPLETDPPPGRRSGFEILDLDVDRRLIVNRRKRIKMYRCWIQGRFRKPLSCSVETEGITVDPPSREGAELQRAP